MMNWEVIGAIGEIIGALAVIITLVFLIVQLKQNTIALQQQSARDSTSSLHQSSIAMMHSDVANSISKAYSGSLPELTIAENAQLEHFMLGYLLIFQQDYLDRKNGLHVSTTWESRQPIMKGLFSAPWAQKWWREMGNTYVTPEFGAVVNELLKNEAEGSRDYWRNFRANET